MTAFPAWAEPPSAEWYQSLLPGYAVPPKLAKGTAPVTFGLRPDGDGYFGFYMKNHTETVRSFIVGFRFDGADLFVPQMSAIPEGRYREIVERNRLNWQKSTKHSINVTFYDNMLVLSTAGFGSRVKIPAGEGVVARIPYQARTQSEIGKKVVMRPGPVRLILKWKLYEGASFEPNSFTVGAACPIYKSRHKLDDLDVPPKDFRMHISWCIHPTFVWHGPTTYEFALERFIAYMKKYPEFRCSIQSGVGFHPTTHLLGKERDRILDELRPFVMRGQCEIISSGLSELFSPLLPGEVLLRNFELGAEFDRRFYGRPSRFSVVNELGHETTQFPQILAGFGYRGWQMGATYPFFGFNRRFRRQRLWIEGPDGSRIYSLPWALFGYGYTTPLSAIHKKAAARFMDRPLHPLLLDSRDNWGQQVEYGFGEQRIESIIASKSAQWSSVSEYLDAHPNPEGTHQLSCNDFAFYWPDGHPTRSVREARWRHDSHQTLALESLAAFVQAVAPVHGSKRIQDQLHRLWDRLLQSMAHLAIPYYETTLLGLIESDQTEIEQSLWRELSPIVQSQGDDTALVLFNPTPWLRREETIVLPPGDLRSRQVSILGHDGTPVASQTLSDGRLCVSPSIPGVGVAVLTVAAKEPRRAASSLPSLEAVRRRLPFRVSDCGILSGLKHKSGPVVLAEANRIRGVVDGKEVDSAEARDTRLRVLDYGPLAIRLRASGRWDVGVSYGTEILYLRDSGKVRFATTIDYGSEGVTVGDRYEAAKKIRVIFRAPPGAKLNVQRDAPFFVVPPSVFKSRDFYSLTWLYKSLRVDHKHLLQSLGAVARASRWIWLGHERGAAAVFSRRRSGYHVADDGVGLIIGGSYSLSAKGTKPLSGRVTDHYALSLRAADEPPAATCREAAQYHLPVLFHFGRKTGAASAARSDALLSRGLIQLDAPDVEFSCLRPQGNGLVFRLANMTDKAREIGLKLAPQLKQLIPISLNGRPQGQPIVPKQGRVSIPMRRWQICTCLIGIDEP